MTSINKSKLCCGGFREALEELWAGAWEMGCCQHAVEFCPFCGTALVTKEDV